MSESSKFLQYPSPVSKVTTYRVPVCFGDCDPAGIVFFPNFCRWMDASSLDFFMQCGVPPWRELEATRGIVGTPLLEINTKFYKAVTYGHTIDIRTCVVDWRGKAFVQRHQIFLNGELMCEGLETRVFTVRPDPAKHQMKAIAVPDDIKALCTDSP